jgi:hypothetical protein
LYKLEPQPVSDCQPSAAMRPNKLLTENLKLKSEVERLRKARDLSWIPKKITKRDTKEDRVRVFMMDTHSSLSDKDAVSAFISDMRMLQPDHIVNIGDLIECGGFLAQHHTWGYVAQSAYSYEEDIEIGNRILDELQKACPRSKIEMLEGNHENRIEKWCVTQKMAHQRDMEGLRRRNAPEFLLNLAQRGIPYYRMGTFYDDMPIPGTILRDKVAVTHNPGFSDARRTLAQFGMSVVHGHDHQSHQLVRSNVKDGDIFVGSFGCLAQKQMLWHHTRPTGHVHGYGLMEITRSGKFMISSAPIINGVSYLGRRFHK